MENTSASIFGEFVQRNADELDYRDFESIVAHELFHQWFGDLVTCESWANLPLNESFATYGEYLWKEYKYGMNAAQANWQADKNSYLRESRSYQEKLIRFYHQHSEEMFDRHTYQKGGLILHALRNYLGDDAFFTGLKEYLHNYEYQPVEAHQLRLSFEKVSGKDLNWFFNQWFYGAGHADLEIKHHYNDSLNLFTITVEQVQDEEAQTFFELQKDAMVCFEEDAVRNGFKEMMEKKVEHAVVVVEEKKEEPIMPLGLAMLLAGGEFGHVLSHDRIGDI
jgi:aminopeptidase N